jgi:hypothetical protein
MIEINGGPNDGAIPQLLYDSFLFEIAPDLSYNHGSK